MPWAVMGEADMSLFSWPLKYGLFEESVTCFGFTARFNGLENQKLSLPNQNVGDVAPSLPFKQKSGLEIGNFGWGRVISSHL